MRSGVGSLPRLAAADLHLYLKPFGPSKTDASLYLACRPSWIEPHFHLESTHKEPDEHRIAVMTDAATATTARNARSRSTSASLKTSRYSLPRSKSGSTSLPSSPTTGKRGLTFDVTTDKSSATTAVIDEATALGDASMSKEVSTDGANWIDAREGYRLMAMHLWQAFRRECLFGLDPACSGMEAASGVAIRYGKGQYVVCPSNDQRLVDFCQSVAVLNCEAAMTLTSSVVAAITTRLVGSITHVPITPCQHIQVVDTMSALAGARKAQNACFVRSEQTLVVWSDKVESLQDSAKDLEEKMIRFVWNSSYYSNANNLVVASSTSGSCTPALAWPTSSTPSSMPDSGATSPISPTFSSKTSISSLANQDHLDKSARNHRPSYQKELDALGRQGSFQSIDGLAVSAAKERAVSGDIASLSTSPKCALLRKASIAADRKVSFTDPAPDPIGIPNEDQRTSNVETPGSSGKVEALVRQAGLQRNNSTFSETNTSQLSSSRSSLSLANEKRQNDSETGESIRDDSDREKQHDEYEQRPLSYIAPLQHGLAVALDILICFLFISKLFEHALRDGDWRRMALAPITLVMFPVILFFCDNIIGIIMQLVGPVNQLHQNSLYFSGKPPVRKLTADLPHITIQMPVYKESLHGVLMPTIESVKKAITTYELQGGTAGIVVSEDGMLLMDKQEQNIRKQFYERNNVGWVARPAHGQEGYLRKGRFKKASNLNFTCHLSMAVEEMMSKARPTTLAELERFHSDPEFVASTEESARVSGEQVASIENKEQVDQQAQSQSQSQSQRLGSDDWSDADETELYRQCLEACLARMHRLAQAKGNIRIGQLILMIDSDTRVPQDCLLDAATEMTQCPDVGVLQHCSGVMLVSDSYFETCIAFFTRLVNFAISFTVANGDVAPFIGHNAILRWSAMQEASFIDPDDQVRKIWSESHVSEDFDMALRLLMAGYITRWATYSNNGFEEGVSLTCDDELNRWQKYAFGCSELVLHRIWHWPFKGLFTPLFKTFLKSSAPIHYKFSACSYIFSYYAIGAAFPMTFGLYLVEGWFYPVLDPSFMTPFKIWVSVVVVFTLGGNVGQIAARYRAKQASLLHLIKEHLSWMPCMFVFFGGLSYHVATALLSHPLGIDMSWGATNKDLADSNFFLEVPLIWKRFCKVILLCTLSIVLVVIMQIPAIVPLNWSIQGFYTYWPLLLTAISHLIYPIVLNPALLRFSF